MNYYESNHYRMYAEHQEMLRNYRTSFLTEPNYVNTNYRNWKSWFSDREMNNLRFMVLAKELLFVENNFGKKEVDFLMNLYKVNCGERLAQHYARLFITIADDPHSELEWALNIRYGGYNSKKEMVMKLFELAFLSGQITLKEYNFIKNAAERMGISRNDFMEMQQQFKIEKTDNNRKYSYRQDFGKVPPVSFLAQTPGQYLYNQHYKNWRDLCYDKLLHKDDMKNLAFLVLASVVITADGPINHAELNFMKKIYANRSGSERYSLIYMLKLRDILKEPSLNWETYADYLYNTFYEEDKSRSWGKSKKEEILEVLFKLAEVDSQISQNELKTLLAIANRLEINHAFQKIASNFDIAKEYDDNNYKTMNNSPLVKAYMTLQINENATDEMVKKAYRKMAQQYHPDRCDNASQKPYFENKMREINNAYNTIMEYRKKNNWRA